MAEVMIIWVCCSCRNALDGNPRICPHCGYTVYEPTWIDDEPSEEDE